MHVARRLGPLAVTHTAVSLHPVAKELVHFNLTSKSSIANYWCRSNASDISDSTIRFIEYVPTWPHMSMLIAPIGRNMGKGNDGAHSLVGWHEGVGGSTRVIDS